MKYRVDTCLRLYNIYDYNLHRKQLHIYYISFVIEQCKIMDWES